MLQGAQKFIFFSLIWKNKIHPRRQEQSFTEKLLNKFVKTCQKKTGYDDFVVAYGDVNFD